MIDVKITQAWDHEKVHIHNRLLTLLDRPCVDDIIVVDRQEYRVVRVMHIIGSARSGLMAAVEVYES